MQRQISVVEKVQISNFKNELSCLIYSGQTDVDGAIIELFTFYSRQNVEEPPFLTLKMQEAIVNGTYEEKVKFLQFMRIV